MVSVVIFLLVAVQAQHPDTSCLVQKPTQPKKPQLLAVDAGPTLVLPNEQCTTVVTGTALTQTSPLTSALANCNSHCQIYDLFQITSPIAAGPSESWTCSCCSGTDHFHTYDFLDLYRVAQTASMIGDPHIKTLDGHRYTLLSQGTFSLWHLSGVQAEWTGEVKKVGVDWEVFTHYSGHQSFTKGLLLVDNSGGPQNQALEITARDCQWRKRKGQEWIAVQNGDSLSVLEGQNYVSSFVVARKDGPKGYNHVHLNMHTKDGPRDIAVLSLSCRPQHHIDLQMVMKRREDRQFVDGELRVGRKKLSLLGTSTDAEFSIEKDWKDLGGSAAAAEYLRNVDEGLKMSAFDQISSCSKAEENEAKETCSKHLAAYVDQNADNAAFFDDCVFDLCHGAGESAAEITAELLASNEAVQTMAS